MAWEAMPPFVIIVLAVGAMGGLQSLVHKGIYGKPKAIGQDDWDRRLNRRDVKILEEAKVTATRLRAGWYRDC